MIYISGGFVALLLCLLTVTSAPRTPTANAQSLTPHIGSDLIDYIVPAGEYLNAGFLLRDFPCVDENNDNDCDYKDNFTSVTYRFDVLIRGPGGTNVDSCEGQGLNSVRTFSPAFYDSDRTLGPIPLRIDRSCENGPYTLLLTVTYIVNADQSHTLTGTVDFVVGDPNQNPNPNPKSDPPPSDPPQPQGPVAITQPRTLRALSRRSEAIRSAQMTIP